MFLFITLHYSWLYHLYVGDYKGKQVAVVTNGIDKRFKVDNVGTIAGDDYDIMDTVVNIDYWMSILCHMYADMDCM